MTTPVQDAMENGRGELVKGLNQAIEVVKKARRAEARGD